MKNIISGRNQLNYFLSKIITNNHITVLKSVISLFFKNRKGHDCIDCSPQYFEHFSKFFGSIRENIYLITFLQDFRNHSSDSCQICCIIFFLRLLQRRLNFFLIRRSVNVVYFNEFLNLCRQFYKHVNQFICRINQALTWCFTIIQNKLREGHLRKLTGNAKFTQRLFQHFVETINLFLNIAIFCSVVLLI